uniref:Putative secreted protein n=1 Tax=Anopheles marajoara TaxID=58244 RepID=A0A2M4C811_9DIPT
MRCSSSTLLPSAAGVGSTEAYGLPSFESVFSFAARCFNHRTRSRAISHVSATSITGSLLYCSRISSTEPSPMAPSASAASCRTIGSCSVSASTFVRAGIARTSCICPRQ